MNTLKELSLVINIKAMLICIALAIVLAIIAIHELFYWLIANLI
jgi:hypothetical protein